MKSLPLLALCASTVTASLGATSTNPDDYDWAVSPEPDADWYQEIGASLPALAEPITTVENGKSYIVKLECLGCPFRVREIGQIYEPWQEPPQDNSLLLNFTIDDTVPALFLNGHSIFPLEPLSYHSINAYQTPANLSANIMYKMVEMKMMDKSWNLGTKYGTFELAYEHTVQPAGNATNTRFEEILQFDITGIDIQYGSNPGSAILDKPGQKLVQMSLIEKVEKDQRLLSIESIDVVDREYKAVPPKMPCGKQAMVKTVYKPTEWDYYGHKGTWSRTWNVLLDATLDGFAKNASLLVIVFLAIVAVRLVRHCKAQSARSQESDAEAGLLGQGESEMDEEVEVDVERSFIEKVAEHGAIGEGNKTDSSLLD